MRRAVFLIAALLVLASVRAAEVTLTVLHTTDLHAQIAPVTDYDGRTGRGGLARLAYRIRMEREREPGLLLVDAGDTIQGSPYGFLTRGRVMVDYLNALRYDAWTIGNHEWDWGSDALRDCLASCRVPMLGANIRPRADLPADDPLRRIVPFVVVTNGGLRIQIIGLTTPGIPGWSLPGLLDETEFPASVPTLAQLTATPADARIVVAHQGWRDTDSPTDEINGIAAAFRPDVIIGGHSHRSVPSKELANGVLYAQAAYWGTELGRVTLTFRDGKLVRKEAVNLAIDDSIPEDPGMAAILGPVRARVDRELDEVVGEAGGVFFPTGPDRDTPLHQLLCAAIAAALRTNGCPVDAVIHGTLNERAGLSPGPIRERDLYELVPYENTLGVVTLTPDQFDAILRESLTASSTKGTGGRRLWGLHAAWNGTNFTWKTPEGQPWPGTNLVRVAFNSYDLAGAGARLPVLARLAADPATRLRLVPIQTRDALRDYFRANRPVRPVVTPWVTGRP